MLTKVFGGLFRAVGLKFLAGWVKDAAEGKHGPRLKAVYWELAGVKSWTGVVVMILGGILLAGGEPAAAVVVASSGAFLVSVGLADKALRQDIPGRFAALRASWIWRLLAQYSGAIASLCVASLVAVRAGTCPGLGCDVWFWLIISFGTICEYIGLFESAWQERPPLNVPALDFRWR